MMSRQERERLMTAALWQAFHHGELDDLADAVSMNNPHIDGNDHPVLKRTAKAILTRWDDAKI